MTAPRSLGELADAIGAEASGFVEAGIVASRADDLAQAVAAHNKAAGMRVAESMVRSFAASTPSLDVGPRAEWETELRSILDECRRLADTARALDPPVACVTADELTRAVEAVEQLVLVCAQVRAEADRRATCKHPPDRLMTDMEERTIRCQDCGTHALLDDKKTATFCSWCGWTCPHESEDTPQAVRDHVATCPKHPAVQRLNELLAAPPPPSVETTTGRASVEYALGVNPEARELVTRVAGRMAHSPHLTPTLDERLTLLACDLRTCSRSEGFDDDTRGIFGDFAGAADEALVALSSSAPAPAETTGLREAATALVAKLDVFTDLRRRVRNAEGVPWQDETDALRSALSAPPPASGRHDGQALEVLAAGMLESELTSIRTIAGIASGELRHLAERIEAIEAKADGVRGLAKEASALARATPPPAPAPPEEGRDGWVRVADRLPDGGWDVLVTDGLGVDVAFWEPNHSPPEWSRHGCQSPQLERPVTHWRPAPEAARLPGTEAVT